MIELRISMPEEMMADLYESDEAQENFRHFIHEVMNKLIDIYKQPPPLSFPSIRSTVFHSPRMITNKDCAICLEPIRLYSNIQIPPCYHGFHTACLNQVLRHRHDCCPLCRKSFLT